MGFESSFKIRSESHVSLFRMVNRVDEGNVLHAKGMESRRNLMPMLPLSRFASLLLQSVRMFAF